MCEQTAVDRFKTATCDSQGCEREDGETRWEEPYWRRRLDGVGAGVSTGWCRD